MNKVYMDTSGGVKCPACADVLENCQKGAKTCGNCKTPLDVHSPTEVLGDPLEATSSGLVTCPNGCDTIYVGSRKTGVCPKCGIAFSVQV